MIIPASTDKTWPSAIVRLVDLTARLRLGFTKGAHVAGYKSDHTMLFGLCRWAQENGVSLSALIASFQWRTLTSLYLDRQQVAGGWPRVVKQLQEVWDEAREHALSLTPQVAAEELSGMATTIATMALPGRGGAAERAVLVAVLEAALRQGTRTPRISRTDMCIATGLAEESMDSATSRLLRDGRIVRTVGSRGRTRWGLRREPIQGGSIPTGWPGSTPPELVPSPADDLWHHSDSSLFQWEILHLLCHVDGLTAGRVAEQLGRHVKSVRPHLNALSDLGLVAMDSDSVWAATLTPGSLSAAAARLGSSGAAERHEQAVLARDVARRDFVDQRASAVRDSLAARALKDQYYASGRDDLPGGGMRFTCLQSNVDFSARAFRERGRPTDFRMMLVPTAWPVVGLGTGVAEADGPPDAAAIQESSGCLYEEALDVVRTSDQSRLDLCQGDLEWVAEIEVDIADSYQA